MTRDLPELRAMLDTLMTDAPVLAIAGTFVAYAAAARLHRAVGSPVWLHPLLLAIVAVASALYCLDISYDGYFQSAQPLHMLLGPVVVLLAVPLWRQLSAIRQIGSKIVPVLAIGALTGIVTSAGIAVLLGAPGDLVSSITPKSVTTPVAINLSEGLGGLPAVTALVVILTGLVGASLGFPVLKLAGITDPRAQGFAVGVASHVIGTARAIQIDQVAGAFSSLGMILNALMTTALIGLFSFGLG